MSQEWWEAPEWGHSRSLAFGDRPKPCRSVVAGKHVEFNAAAGRWVSTPIRLFVGRKALEVK